MHIHTHSHARGPAELGTKTRRHGNKHTQVRANERERASKTERAHASTFVLRKVEPPWLASRVWPGNPQGNPCFAQTWICAYSCARTRLSEVEYILQDAQRRPTTVTTTPAHPRPLLDSSVRRQRRSPSPTHPTQQHFNRCAGNSCSGPCF